LNERWSLSVEFIDYVAAIFAAKQFVGDARANEKAPARPGPSLNRKKPEG
jgi:hypothetical protein